MQHHNASSLSLFLTPFAPWWARDQLSSILADFSVAPKEARPHNTTGLWSIETRPPGTASSPSTARTSCRSLRRQHRLALLHLYCPSRPCHYHRRCAAAGTATPTSFPLEEPFSHNQQDDSLDRASPSTATDGRTLSLIPKTIGGERDHKGTSCHFYRQ